MEPKLIKEYVDDGILRIEWRDFPYRGQESVNAALAARAAQAQGKFWEYHDLLYKNQQPANSGGFSTNNLIGFARKSGLDLDRFKSDLTGAKYRKEVTHDFIEGQRRGIAGTPTFVINGRVLSGYQPVKVFEKAIEQAKERSKSG